MRVRIAQDIEKAVELGWEFEDRPWPRAGGAIIDVCARKGGVEHAAAFHKSRTKTDRPNALRVVLRSIVEDEGVEAFR